MVAILRTTISNKLVNKDFIFIIENILKKVRINYYNYSRFSELLINKLVVNNQISDFEIDQTFFSKCLQYSSYKTNEMTLLEKPISFKRIANEEKQDIIILELRNKIINLIKTSDFEKYYNDNLVFFEDKQYIKYKKLKKQGKLDLDDNSFDSEQIKNYEKIIEFDMLYSEYLKNIKKIETIKKRQSDDELFDKYGFKVYQDWIKQNPKIESRSCITNIMAEFTNVLSVTNFKNYYTTNFINWQIEYASLHFRDYFEDKKLLLQFSKIIQKSINYGNNLNWENIGLINYEDLGEKRFKYIKEKNKWIRKNIITEKPKDYDYIDLPNYINSLTELFKMKLCNEIVKFIKDERNKLFENNEKVYLNQNYLSGNNFKPEKFIKYIYNISDTFEKNNNSNNTDIVSKKQFYNTKFLNNKISYKPVGTLRNQQRVIRKRYLKYLELEKEIIKEGLNNKYYNGNKNLTIKLLDNILNEINKIEGVKVQKNGNKMKKLERIKEYLLKYENDKEKIPESLKKIDYNLKKKMIINPKPFSLLPIPSFNIKNIRITKKNIKDVINTYNNSEYGSKNKVKYKETNEWWDCLLNIDELKKQNKKKTKNITSFITDGVQLIICNESEGLDLNIKQCQETESINIKEIIEKETGSIWNSENIYIDEKDYKNYEIIGIDPNVSNIGEWVNGSIVNNEIVWEKNKKNYKKNVSIGLWNSANGSVKNKNYDIIKKKKLCLENSYDIRNIMRSVKYETILDINKDKNNYLKKSEIYHSERRKRRHLFEQSSKKEKILNRLVDWIVNGSIKKKPQDNDFNKLWDGHPLLKGKTRYEKKLKTSNTKKKIIAFGAGDFKPGGFGYSTIPRKGLINSLVKKGYHVILTDEYNTTKKCSVCNKNLLEPTNNLIKNYLRKSKNNYSLKDARNVRCCNHHSSTGDYILFTGRDLDAAKSIGQKLFTDLKKNYKSLTKKASSKENSTLGLKV
jgi:hypothetical protein